MTTRKKAPTTVTEVGSKNDQELENRIASLEEKLNTLIGVLKANPKNNIEKLSKGLL